MSYTFLSDDWFDAARKLRAEAGDLGGDPDLKINAVVTGGPDGDKEVHLAAGAFGQGLVEGAPTKLTVPFEVAKSTFIEGNQQAAMQAFMSGQIKIEGDMTKIMAMQAAPPNSAQQQLADKLRGITA
ncbi:MAG: SCP2 sterol-binding domain-containing protein [Acidimicrobiia bacterium]|nr:SCP2 sterol-binding domain-containing protein [Acidimicrobiia bacterium]